MSARVRSGKPVHTADPAMPEAQAASCRDELEKAGAMAAGRDDGRRFLPDYSSVALGFVDRISCSPP